MSKAMNNLAAQGRFHNMSAEMLADAIGHADAIQKAAETELKALKDEFKRRGLTDVAGGSYTVTSTEQISARLDTDAVRKHLGDAVFGFERAAISTVVRVKPSARAALQLAA